MSLPQTLQSFSDIKILSDARRLTILRLLMESPATLSHLGDRLEMSPARVRHHLKILEEAGFVELVETKVVRGFVAKYYQTTAQAYFVNTAVLPQPAKQGTIFAIGSHDPALEMLSAVLGEDTRLPKLVTIPVGSLDGLIALRQGFCQIAGCHLFDPVGGEYNTSYVRHFFPGQPMHIVTLAHRKQGLLVKSGNPRGIQGVADLAREDVIFINRKNGSGTRLWLDQEIKKMGLDVADITGYGHEVNTHTQVAAAVQAGQADVGLAVFAGAKKYGVDFIPLFDERFDLVIADDPFHSDILLPFLEYLQTSRFRQSINQLGGYNPNDTGREVPYPFF